MERDSKIDIQHWVGILQTDSSVSVIGHGKFPDIMEALMDSKIDREHWVGILQTGSAVSAVSRGMFPRLLQQLTSVKVEPKDFHKFLNSNHTVHVISRDSDIQVYIDSLSEYGLTNLTQVISIL